MRSIWKGSLAFGLVNVPIKVYTATEDNDIRFHQVHAADGGRIRYQRVCEVCGEKVEFAEIDKAYQAEDGRTVILTDEDFQQLPVSQSREIEVSSFVPADQIDPVLFDKSYYLEPASKSTKAYVLLQRTLESTDRIAIVHFALRQKTRLAALRVRDDVLVVQTLLWPDEVRAAHFASLDEDVDIKPAELKMAATLVDSFADDFRPEDYTDTYRAELEQLIDAKLEGGEAFPAQETESSDEDAEVVDLLAALRRSVQRHKGGAQADESGESTDTADTKAAAKDDDEAPVKPTRRRTPAAKKDTAEKDAAPAKPARKPAAKKAATKADPDAQEGETAPRRRRTAS
ncbi:Ku protein [Nakamurella flavida]|uniref:Non-homologous end joining protein Ku n=1 Tax=Nakamurella flavida TaxID=363630 RepID=A0A938YR62_9ACTN|nr:Ku protein [Nakamurella flavida]MBM9477934.1 Ku protein [Nakamurella flavida]MDP9778350.1 DNA end-binding protein Ku [Nakamurella flavida]